MEKKKLGLSGKSKLELSKTIRGGTVRQSFSHGRVKSVEVEVKKVRTFNKNGSNSGINSENRNISEAYNSISKIENYKVFFKLSFNEMKNYNSFIAEISKLNNV